MPSHVPLSFNKTVWQSSESEPRPRHCIALSSRDSGGDINIQADERWAAHSHPSAATLKRPVGAEHVAQIIGPAISSWSRVSQFRPPPPVVAAATATASTSTAAVAMPIAATAPPERERRRQPRPAHMSDGDRDRLAGIGIAAKPSSRGDEMRS